jgi:hypothetical protein
MNADKTAIERAFELARAGACSSVAEIVVRLDREGYDGRQICGRALRRQLRDSIEELRNPRDDSGEPAPAHARQAIRNRRWPRAKH